MTRGRHSRKLIRGQGRLRVTGCSGVGGGACAGRAGPLGGRVIQGIFFKHDFWEKRYSLIYERGFLCSFAPAHWAEYVARMAELLLPGGRLVGLFLYGSEPEPPFPLTDETAAAVLGHSFRLVNVEAAAADSVPVYQGLERWQEWEKIG